MPAYNAEKYIGEAIESILNQTFTDFEFIIIDDCSTDRTWNIIQSYAAKDKRIIPVRNTENLKISRTLNKGLAIAKGEYIARMDADDWSYPDRLFRQVEHMEKNTDIVISGSSIDVCNESLLSCHPRKYYLDDTEIRKHIFYFSPFCHAATIYRTKSAKDASGYNEDLFDAEDYDFYFRLAKLGKLSNIPSTLYKMRVNSEGVSLTKGRRQEALTLYIRIKAVMEYGYRMNSLEKIYFFLQALSMLIVPPKMKYWIYNKIRNG